ncbi:MAG: hypothetical protein K2K96_07920 [Lachnospiraceae bacterium]|nr:hypothetical protein [Lachnospiraceae bacterium]
MKSVAIGIPTYHHPEAVNEILSLTAQYLYDLHIDVYYYDGSSDTKTKEVVENFRSKGFTNLYHLHFPEDNHRAEMIFNGHGMLREYDYIWPSKDRCMFTEEVLTAVIEALEEDPDILCLNQTFAYHGIQKRIYHEPTEFYHVHGWITTSINTVIYKKSTMIGSFQSWIYPKLFNPYYSHLFHTLAGMDEMKICVLYGDHIMIHNSADVVSQWENKVFKVWKDDWIKVNDLLPECYAPYKDNVIKITASLPWLLGDVERLQELYEKGLLTPETMSQVEPNWERVSYVPIEIVREIAAGIFDSAHDMRRVVSESEFTDMTISIHKMLLAGQMNISQIPWEAFQNYIHNRLQSQKRMNTEEIAQILTAIRSLRSFSEEKPDDIGRAANIVQMILVFLFFTDRNKTLSSISTRELRGLIATICENIRDHLMAVDEIPWKAFQDYMHEHLEGLNVVEIPNIPLIMGSIGDLEQLSLEQPDNTERLTNLINVVTVLLLLMEKG